MWLTSYLVIDRTCLSRHVRWFIRPVDVDATIEITVNLYVGRVYRPEPVSTQQLDHPRYVGRLIYPSTCQFCI